MKWTSEIERFQQKYSTRTDTRRAFSVSISMRLLSESALFPQPFRRAVYQSNLRYCSGVTPTNCLKLREKWVSCLNPTS